MEQSVVIPAQFADDLRQAQEAEQRYLQHGGTAALDDASAAWNRVASQPRFAEATLSFRLAVLNSSAVMYLYRNKSTGSLEDLGRAIALFQQIVQLSPPESSNLPMYLDNLGTSLRDRYVRSGDLADLAEAIRVYQQVVQRTPADSPDLPARLNSLGAGLWVRYARSGDLADLAEAIRVYQQAVEATPVDSPDLPARLNNLGAGLWVRYARSGDLVDLAEAIRAGQQAVEATPVDSPDLPGYLSNLGNGLRGRYARSGDQVDLAGAIRVYQQAVKATPVDSPDLPALLSNLGNGLRVRYARSGDLADLGEAIRVYRQAVQATPVDSPDLPGYLSNLGAGLSARYARSGDLADLAEAIRVYQQAVQDAPAGSPNLPALRNNLGAGLWVRYARSGDLADLAEAIRAGQQAVEAMPIDSPALPGYLSNLGNGLRDRYARSGDLVDLAEAIRVYQQAVQHTPDDSPDLPRYLINLGVGLRSRYAHSGDLADLAEAIRVYQQAVEATPVDSPDLPGYLNNLGNGLSDRFARSGDLADLAEAIDTWEQAAKRGLDVAVEEGLRSARNWMNSAFERASWPEVLRAYDYVRGAIDTLVKTQWDRPAKESFLKETQGLPATAAYALARLGRLEQAVEALDAGRSRLLAEALERNRRDLERLPELGHGDFMTRYHEAAGHVQFFLQQASRRGGQSPDLQVTQIDLSTRRHEMEAARAELAAAVEAIRTVEGYEDFLLSPGFDKIQSAVTPGIPLVYLVVTAAGGLALILHAPQASPAGQSAGPVEAVWLDDLTDTGVQEMLGGPPGTRVLGGYLGAYYRWRAESSTDTSHAWYGSLDSATRWLGEKVMGPLAQQLTTVARTKLPEPGDGKDGLPLPAITLVATGLLGLLPLHAAWHEVDGQRRIVLDDLIVAYAPGAQALGVARGRQAELQRQGRQMLAVVNPSGDLPFSGVEAEQVMGYFSSQAAQSLAGPQATQDAVVEALPGQAYLHFASHGYYDPDDVLHSGLMLAEENPLELREILELGLDLSATRLVTLSACETGLTEFRKVPDETVGLPAGFLQAGAPAVVSSLWAVNDFSTSLLMGEFYRRHLTAGQGIAEALRGAQLWLRDLTRDQVLDLIEPVRERPRNPGLYKAVEVLYWRLLEKDDAETDCPYVHPYYWGAFTASGAVS